MKNTEISDKVSGRFKEGEIRKSLQWEAGGGERNPMSKQSTSCSFQTYSPKRIKFQVEYS